MKTNNSHIGFGGQAREGRTNKNRESLRGIRLDKKAIVKSQLLTRRPLGNHSAGMTQRKWNFSFLGKSDYSENCFTSSSVYKVRKKYTTQSGSQKKGNYQLIKLKTSKVRLALGTSPRTASKDVDETWFLHPFTQISCLLNVEIILRIHPCAFKVTVIFLSSQF